MRKKRWGRRVQPARVELALRPLAPEGVEIEVQSPRHQQHEPEVPSVHQEDPVQREHGAAFERGLEPEPGDRGERRERDHDRPEERAREEVPDRGERSRWPDEDGDHLEGELRVPGPAAAAGSVTVGEPARRDFRARHGPYLRTLRHRSPTAPTADEIVFGPGRNSRPFPTSHDVIGTTSRTSQDVGPADKARIFP